MHSCNQFKLCKESFITTEEVPENIISLREVARHNSNLGGQGYNKCGCTQKCKTQKCKCKAAGKLCNSKCHSSNSWSNINYYSNFLMLPINYNYYVSNQNNNKLINVILILQ